MYRMFYLCDVLKFIINGFYKCPFSQTDIVRHTLKRVFYIVLYFCDELCSIHKESLKKSFPIYLLSPKSFVYPNYRKNQYFYDSTICKKQTANPLVKYYVLN